MLTTLNQAFFQVVSMATTAGFTTDSIARWPLFLPVLLLCSAFIGGCAGSTGGGLKVIRILLLFKQGNRELKRLVHPNAVYSIKLGNRALPEMCIRDRPLAMVKLIVASILLSFSGSSFG